MDRGHDTISCQQSPSASPGSDLQVVLQNPVAAARNALTQAHCNILQSIDHVHDRVQPLQNDLMRRARKWWCDSPLGILHRRELSHALQGPWTPVIASVGISWSVGLPSPRHQRKKLDNDDSSEHCDYRNAWNVLTELAMAKDEVKARLAPIPVYTVANPKNEFVLVAGENNTQLGFFFLNRDDAECIVEKIREENPRLARDSKILRVTMDNVYEVFTTPREQTGLQGIHFRFMPDMRQVSHALDLYKEAGLPTRTFVGVPVFQAEGLTVTTQDMQYVPLFLCKEDLGVAVQSAYRQRNAAQIKVFRDKAQKHEDEYNEVLERAQNAVDREKSKLESQAAKAKTKLDAAIEKAEAVERAPLPRIEVGSFEEVMMRMTGSSGSELAAWNQVMFVSPGLLQKSAIKEGE